MGTQVNVQEAKTQLSGLLALVERSEPVVIARRGQPGAELTPVRQPVVALGFRPADVSDEAALPLDAEELAAWEAE
ncbi:MAG: type II toxin-antitoxin system prevent-host-death family antitoxin [Bifidobacteriaceae bacterium]|jgi:prevent-host-death family protein|nr:type II toxin-antitoxin system prevent-host-death family antitoxin [Bifidobacteriaceae bacterium]